MPATIDRCPKELTAANTNLLLRFASAQFLKKVGDGRLPNGWGLYDMLGNCGELTLDAYVYSSDYKAYGGSMPISGYDPVGIQGDVATTNTLRIMRGLSFSGDLNTADFIAHYMKVEAGTRSQGVCQYTAANWSSYRTSCMRWVVELDDWPRSALVTRPARPHFGRTPPPARSGRAFRLPAPDGASSATAEPPPSSLADEI